MQSIVRHYAHNGHPNNLHNSHPTSAAHSRSIIGDASKKCLVSPMALRAVDHVSLEENIAKCTSNDLNVQSKNRGRLGIQAADPIIRTKSRLVYQIIYENSFRVLIYGIPFHVFSFSVFQTKLNILWLIIQFWWEAQDVVYIRQAWSFTWHLTACKKRFKTFKLKITKFLLRYIPETRIPC